MLGCGLCTALARVRWAHACHADEREKGRRKVCYVYGRGKGREGT